MKTKIQNIFVVMAVLAMLMTACAPKATPTPELTVAPTTAPVATTAPAVTTAPPTAGVTKITMWSHAAGNDTELATIKNSINLFNSTNDKYYVVLNAFPQASYNDSVTAGAVAGSLPDIIDMDGPTVPNFAWSKYIQPLPITDADVKAMGILPTDVGRYNGKIYSMGEFDVALLIFGRKSILNQYNIRIPTLDKPWTNDEFMTALDTLKASKKFQYAIDVNPNWTGEWWPYAYSPMLQSFGGDLIDRKTYTTADGVLNGPEALAWGKWFQGLFKNGYANPTPADNNGFLQGTIPLWYTGSWSANDVTKKWGDDALFVPAVDFGKGPKIGAGSWEWGISANSKHAEGAWEFIKFLMAPEQVAAMSKATGLIPTTPAAAELTDTYKTGGPYRVFYDMLAAYAVVRPPTPGYLIISSAFEKAGNAIRDGNDVQNALDDAVDKIDQDIKDHNNYGFK